MNSRVDASNLFDLPLTVLMSLAVELHVTYCSAMSSCLLGQVGYKISDARRAADLRRRFHGLESRFGRAHIWELAIRRDCQPPTPRTASRDRHGFRPALDFLVAVWPLCPFVCQAAILSGCASARGVSSTFPTHTPPNNVVFLPTCLFLLRPSFLWALSSPCSA